MIPASLGSRNNVVGTILLVGGNEVRVVDARQRLDAAHLLADKLLEGRLEDAGTVHGISQVHTADVPAANGKVVGVDHGEHVMEGDVDLLASFAVSSELDGRAHDEGAIVVGSTLALAGVPGETIAVGQDTGGNSSSVVSTQANEHHADLGNLAVDLEVIDALLGDGNELAILRAGYSGGAVDILGLDGLVGVDDVGGVNCEEISLGSGGYRPVNGAIGSNVCVGSHCYRNVGIRREKG